MILLEFPGYIQMNIWSTSFLLSNTQQGSSLFLAPGQPTSTFTTIQINNSTFNENIVTGVGGAIYAEVPVFVSTSNFYGNEAYQGVGSSIFLCFEPNPYNASSYFSENHFNSYNNESEIDIGPCSPCAIGSIQQSIYTCTNISAFNCFTFDNFEAVHHACHHIIRSLILMVPI